MSLGIFLLNIAGLIATFQISLWNTRWFRYNAFQKCPFFFYIKWAPALCWLLPISIFALIVIVYKYHFSLLLLYAVLLEAGVLKAKREYIAHMTKVLMEQEGLSLDEAKKGAKLCEKTIRKVEI